MVSLNQHEFQPHIHEILSACVFLGTYKIQVGIKLLIFFNFMPTVLELCDEIEVYFICMSGILRGFFSLSQILILVIAIQPL